MELQPSAEWSRAMAGEVAYDELVQQPLVMERGGAEVIVADRRHRRSAFDAWVGASWVGVVLLTAWVAYTSPWLVRGWTGLLIAAVLLASGLLAWQRGRIGGGDEWRALARVDLREGTLSVRGSATLSLADCAVIHRLEDVDEVLYASRRVRVSDTGQGDGVGVFVRFRDGSVWPVIPSTLAQGEAYRAATRLAQVLEVRLKQVGVGFIG